MMLRCVFKAGSGDTKAPYLGVGDGGSQIFVEPFARDGTFMLISPRGGEELEMLPDEDTLLYGAGRNWLKVTYGKDLDFFSDPVLAVNGSTDTIWFVETGVYPNRFVGFDTRSESFKRGTDVPSGGGTIRHMYFDENTGYVWFGADSNTVGRAIVSAREGS